MTMHPAYSVSSWIFSIALLTAAETIFNDNSANLGTLDSDIFDSHEANSYLDTDLFSTTDPVNTDSEDFSSSSSAGSFIADAGVNDNAATPCLSSAFQNPLAADILQARSPKQCTNPVKDSESGVNVNIDPLRAGSMSFTLQWAGSDPHLCPYERYGPRSVPLCDSGLQYDIVQDESTWMTELVNPTICMYDFISAL